MVWVNLKLPPFEGVEDEGQVCGWVEVEHRNQLNYGSMQRLGALHWQGRYYTIWVFRITFHRGFGVDFMTSK
jgi:hypothetical protein